MQSAAVVYNCEHTVDQTQQVTDSIGAYMAIKATERLETVPLSGAANNEAQKPVDIIKVSLWPRT